MADDSNKRRRGYGGDGKGPRPTTRSTTRRPTARHAEPIEMSIDHIGFKYLKEGSVS